MTTTRHSGFPAPFRLLAAAAAMVAFTACAVNPVTGQNELSLLSEAQEIQMGAEAYPLYTQMSEGLYRDDALQAYVQMVGEKVARSSHRPNLDYRFNVVNSSDVNAYALPGGKISITRGLLTRMGNEAQLAAVLAHEVGHVTARHAAAGHTRQILADVLTQVGVGALQRAKVQGAEVLAQGGLLAANLVLQKYSRDQERQADELGLGYMTQAGYNPEGMAQTMEILLASQQQEPSTVDSMFQSHPLSSERLKTARTSLPKLDPALRTRAALGAESFASASASLHKVAPAYAKMDEGRRLLADRREGEAITLLQEATAAAPEEALLWVYRAAAEAKAGKQDAALSSAERAVTLYPDLFLARFTAGVTAFEAKRFRDALSQLDAADELVPGRPQVTFFRGRAYESFGDRGNAARQFEDVVQRVGKGPMAEYSYNKLLEWGYLKPAGK